MFAKGGYENLRMSLEEKMNKFARDSLKNHGYKIGDASEFLNLTDEESAFVEMKVSLAQFLLEKRKDNHLTQIEFAKLIRSSQSRVAKMEKGEPSVTIDLILRSLIALGTGPKEIARKIEEVKPRKPMRVKSVIKGKRKVTASLH
jgi:plasmid maintenance system antidote protein VapI